MISKAQVNWCHPGMSGIVRLPNTHIAMIERADRLSAEIGSNMQWHFKLTSGREVRNWAHNWVLKKSLWVPPPPSPHDVLCSAPLQAICTGEEQWLFALLPWKPIASTSAARGCKAEWAGRRGGMGCVWAFGGRSDKRHHFQAYIGMVLAMLAHH